ncbi:kinase-like domain-containing protein [Lasiosphaeria hispida]|uniref:EKC/KEOPS complex subunit BUD32 n=1 Tax=Lasiosphaeria hispida TaxID=260671 RepID=A0AAJ0HJF9_9PEZI|nr:kinase-like domain-containing protein [Lasiosphaeria hispida]
MQFSADAQLSGEEQPQSGSQSTEVPQAAGEGPNPQEQDSDAVEESLGSHQPEPEHQPPQANVITVYYDIENDCLAESISKYERGGFHPVHLGDSLGSGGRFRVLHKLGYGGFATVWLCRDALTQKLRAVKINAACLAEEETKDIGTSEFAVSETFRDHSADELAANGIVLPLEYFWLTGPNGTHLCSVLPFLGPQLTYVSRMYAHCDSLLKDICFQLVSSMDFLHRHGVCHGDFRPDNILFQLVDGADEWTDEELYAAVGVPETTTVVAMEGFEHQPTAPKQLVGAMKIDYGSGFCTNKTALVDFGVAYAIDDPPKSSGIPLGYAPPEDIFQRSSMGPASDIWSLACSIGQVRMGCLLFDERGEVEEAVAGMEGVLGPLPLLYRGPWKDDFGYGFVNDETDESLPVAMGPEDTAWLNTVKSKGFVNTLEAKLSRPKVTMLTAAMMEHIGKQMYQVTGVLPTYSPTMGELLSTLRFRDRAPYSLGKEEAKQLFDLLNGIFKWHPEERPSMEQVLNHPWFGYRNLCYYRG